MKERNSGVDLLRIIAMYMIVIVHIFNHSGVLENEYSLSIKIVYILLYTIVFASANCYALISGYVGYREKAGYNFISYINLWFQVVFYGIFVLVILSIVGIVPFSFKSLIEALLPVTRNQYWYFTAYTGVFLLAPLINMFIKNIEERTAKTICKVLIVAFSFYGTMAINLGGDPFCLGAGYSMVWLSFLYLLGALIKRYKWDEKILQKYHSSKVILIFIVCVILTSIWFLGVKTVTLKVIGFTWGEWILLTYTSPTILCMALCFLILFANMKLKNRNAIKTVAAGTFAVYLLHEQPVIRVVLRKSLKWIKNVEGLWSVVVILGLALVIFVLGILIDYVRRKLFQRCKIQTCAEKMDRIIWKMINIFD